MGEVPIMFGGLRSQVKDIMAPLSVLDKTHDVSLFRALLRHPVNRVQGGHTGKPSAPHYIEYGGGRGHPQLDNKGG